MPNMIWSALISIANNSAPFFADEGNTAENTSAQFKAPIRTCMDDLAFCMQEVQSKEEATEDEGEDWRR